jgi:hypothetical protein
MDGSEDSPARSCWKASMLASRLMAFHNRAHAKWRLRFYSYSLFGFSDLYLWTATLSKQTGDKFYIFYTLFADSVQWKSTQKAAS